MSKVNELELLYQGDIKRLGGPDEYLYCFMEALLPIIGSWSVDEWGDPVIEVKAKLELSGKEFITILESLLREQAVMRYLDGTSTVKISII